MDQKKQIWIGRILSGLVGLFMLMDIAFKFMPDSPQVQETMAQLGFSMDALLTIGILNICCFILYFIPQTSILGAILYTGYLGGAIAIHLRVGNPLFSHLLFPVYVGLFIWGGVYFREPRLRALIPFKRN